MTPVRIVTLCLHRPPVGGAGLFGLLGLIALLAAGLSIGLSDKPAAAQDSAQESVGQLMTADQAMQLKACREALPDRDRPDQG